MQFDSIGKLQAVLPLFCCKAAAIPPVEVLASNGVRKRIAASPLR